MPLCACGCGVETKGGNTWIHGHNRQFSSLINPMHEEKTRNKMSASLKGSIPWNKGKKTGCIPWNKGKESPYPGPMKGKHHTEETRIKISEKTKAQWQDPDWRDKMVLHLRKISRDPKIVTKMAERIRELWQDSGISMGMKGKQHTKESNAKNSASKVDYIQKHGGVNPPASGHGLRGIFESKKGGGALKYESSYELRAFVILEGMAHIKTFWRCPYAIDYPWQDGIKKYIPDVLVEYECGAKEIIEVKAGWELVKEKVQAKFFAAQKFCLDSGMAFSVWTEKELN